MSASQSNRTIFCHFSSEGGGGESSAAIRGRVVAAREIRAARFRKSSNATNSVMGPRQVKTHCKIHSESMGYLEHAMQKMSFSARAHDRILEVARTLANLAGAVNIQPADVREAIQYRSLDRKLFS
jgi:magnesium chelatase family protein